MALELMKQEVLKEMEAVKCFIEYAIEAQQSGYVEAAKFFLEEAREDCEHAFLYARELDKFHKTDKNQKNIMEITRSYYDLEYGAIDRISEIYKEAKEKNIYSIYPFLTDMMSKHSEDCYKAKKMLQKIEILHHSESINDIEDIFVEKTE